MSGFQHSCATRHAHESRNGNGTRSRALDSYLRADGRRASQTNRPGRIPRRDPFRPQEVPNSRPCRSQHAVSHDFGVSASADPPSPDVTSRQATGCIREILYKSKKKCTHARGVVRQTLSRNCQRTTVNSCQSLVTSSRLRRPEARQRETT